MEERPIFILIWAAAVWRVTSPMGSGDQGLGKPVDVGGVVKHHDENEACGVQG